MERFTIDIGKDFNDLLGGRFRALGDHSGEEFFEDILEPKFLEAKENKDFLHIYLDNAKSYPSSFVDQSFGELGRMYGNNIVKNIIVFHSIKFPLIVNHVENNLWDENK